MIKSLKTLITARNDETLRAALKALVNFSLRKDRITHPEGHTDNGGRWFPSGLDATAEMNVRYPSRSWPWSYMVRCRTLEHCEIIFDAFHDEVLALRSYFVAHEIAITSEMHTVVGEAKVYETLCTALAEVEAADRARQLTRRGSCSRTTRQLTTSRPRLRA